jgi:CheY-like chemotaxis protein
MKQKLVRGKRILLVDDQSSVRESLRLLFEIDDHIVTEANNGVEALDLFTKGQFDLVVTDFEMPVMKGDELAVRIKRLAPTQPILMITAYGKELGDPTNPVDRILNKPFTLEDLREAIATLLSH